MGVVILNIGSRHGNSSSPHTRGAHRQDMEQPSLFDQPPILLTIPLQLFAYHCSKALGRDIDKPRNLAKSVTVE